MKRSDKQLKELESVLGKGKLSQIEKAIGDLRDEEAFEGAIGLLIALYDSSDNNLRKVIECFMNDMKDPDGREEVITEIRKPWNNATITMIASSCWQSGLDYSAYSGDFLKVFIERDYAAALESLTVIEEFAHEIESIVKSDMIKLLKSSSASPHTEKTTLTRELIAILSR